MDSTALLWIFLSVWLAFILLYIVFKACGGRVIDLCSCECCSGPCADCWGNGGRIDQYDREYPFARGVIAPARPSRGSLPVIIISHDSSSDEEDGEEERERKERSRADGPMLLQSKPANADDDPVTLNVV